MEKTLVGLSEIQQTTGLSTLGTELVSVMNNINNPIADANQNWVISIAPIDPANPHVIDAHDNNWLSDRSTYDTPIRQEELVT
jgi:hypothetical protein